MKKVTFRGGLGGKQSEEVFTPPGVLVILKRRVKKG